MGVILAPLSLVGELRRVCPDGFVLHAVFVFFRLGVMAISEAGLIASIFLFIFISLTLIDCHAFMFFFEETDLSTLPSLAHDVERNEGPSFLARAERRHRKRNRAESSEEKGEASSHSSSADTPAVKKRRLEDDAATNRIVLLYQ